MERLRLEQLARLVDEQPTPEEQAVLDGDPRLRRELEALKSQTRSLGNLPDMLPPAGGWHQLERKLVSIGLINDPSGPFVWRRWLQAAAILVVFIGGTAVGWVTASEYEPGPGGAENFAVAPASIDEARLAVENGERNYRQALEAYQEFRYAQGGQQFSPNPAMRIAVLDAVAGAIYLAVEAAPADPFLNGLLFEVRSEQEQELLRLNWH
jgi:hypothetical protein